MSNHSSPGSDGSRDLSRPPRLDVSVVIPVYGVQPTIAELVRRIADVLTDRGVRFEIIAVDDCSPDQSARILGEMLTEVAQLRLIRFPQNFGQHAALSAGIAGAAGRSILTIDGDLEYAPEDIPLLLDKLDEGHDFVNGWRRKNREPLVRRRFPAWLFQLVAGSVTGVRLRDYGSGLVGIDHRIGRQLESFGEMRRFLKPMMVSLAADPVEIPISHRLRQGSRSGYTFFRLLSVAFDFLIHFSRKPFQVVALIGGILGSVSLATGLILLFLRFAFGVWLPPQLQIVLILSFFMGVQFLVLGLLGEVLTSVHGRVARHPFYVVAEDSGPPDRGDDDRA